MALACASDNNCRTSGSVVRRVSEASFRNQGDRTIWSDAWASVLISQLGSLTNSRRKRFRNSATASRQAAHQHNRLAHLAIIASISSDVFPRLFKRIEDSARESSK